MARKPPFIEAHPVGYEEAADQRLTRAVCLYVVDGDTADFMIDLGWYQYSYAPMRLARINTSETRGTSGAARDMAIRARSRVEELIKGQPVLIRSFRQKQSFERFIAEVWFASKSPPLGAGEVLTLGDERWVNLSDSLLYDGLAQPGI